MWIIPDTSRCAGPTSWVKTDHWRCVDCFHEFVGQQFCPKCGSEDTFPSNDGLWFCEGCGERNVNFGGTCFKCIYDLHEEPPIGL